MSRESTEHKLISPPPDLLSLSFAPPVLPEYPVVLNRWGRQLNGTTLGPKEEVIAQLGIIAGYKLQQSLSSHSRAMTYC